MRTFLTTACSSCFPSLYFSKLLVHLVPLVAKTENSLVLSPLFAGSIIPQGSIPIKLATWTWLESLSYFPSQ